jgi:hypothetical protein
MNPEEFSEEFFEVLRGIVSGEVELIELKEFMARAKNDCDTEDLEFSEFLEEAFPDAICEEVHELINGSSWRSDEVGTNCVTDSELLSGLFPVLVQIDQNNELVFATNPNTPKEIIEKLTQSTYSWEEDGTTNTLARNTTNPSILEKLSDSADSSTRFSVAANPHTPRNVLMKLASDEDFSQNRVYVSLDGGMSPHVTDLASEIVSCSIKYAVVNNLNTPSEIVHEIANKDNNFSAEKVESYFGVENVDDVNLAMKIEAMRVQTARN